MMVVVSDCRKVTDWICLFMIYKYFILHKSIIYIFMLLYVSININNNNKKSVSKLQYGEQ